LGSAVSPASYSPSTGFYSSFSICRKLNQNKLLITQRIKIATLSVTATY